MNNEVDQPILNSPFREPECFWYLQEGKLPEKREGRRRSFVFEPRDQRTSWTTDGRILAPSALYSGAYELVMVNLIRERLHAWEQQGYPGASRTTTELLAYWQDEGREKRLFYAQLEAAKTIIFLVEARQDLLQGIAVPRDEPSVRSQGCRVRRLSPLCVQDGDWRGQDDGDGHAVGLEHPEQGGEPWG